MPFAATHIITTISIFDRVKLKYFPNIARDGSLPFFAAFGGLLPDIDIPLRWFLNYFQLDFEHGTITHTLFFALIFAFISSALLLFKKNKCSEISLVFALGIVIHILLDFTLGGGAMEGIAWFYPFSTATYRIHLLFLLPFDNSFEALDALVLLYCFYRKCLSYSVPK